MAKQILLNFLADHLGEYFEGLSSDNLKVGIWSGHVHLKNLQLRAEAIENLNLPIRLAHGLVKSIRIAIPWASLGSSPIIVTIDGIYAEVDYCNRLYSSSELEEIANKLKKDILDMSERLAYSRACANIRVSSADYKDETVKYQSFTSFIHTYAQRMLTKMLGNLEVTVENIHFRYEDNFECPQPIAAGFSIERLSLKTAEEHEGSHHNKTSFFKNLSISNISVYWDCNSIPIREVKKENSFGVRLSRSGRSLSFKDTGSCDETEWLEDMKKMVYSATEVESYKRHLHPAICVIAAPNLVMFDIVHNSAAENNAVPRLELACMISPAIPCIIDQSQLIQFVDVLKRIAVFEKKQRLMLFRPKQRPTENPRAWWVYAYQLVTGRAELVYNYKTRLEKCLKMRDKYLDLVTKSYKPTKASQWVPHDALESFIAAHHVTVELTPAEQQLKTDIEDSLPIQALIVYRKLAMEFFVRREYIKKIRLKAEAEELKLQNQADLQEGGILSACVPRAVLSGTIRSAVAAREAVISVVPTSFFINSTTAVRKSVMDSLNNIIIPRNNRHVAVDSDSEIDVDIEEVKREMEAEIEASEEESCQDVLLLRCNFGISLDVTLAVRRKPMLSVKASTTSCLLFHSMSHSCSTFSLNDLEIQEGFCPNSKKPVILSLLPRGDQPPSSHVDEDLVHKDAITGQLKSILGNIIHTSQAIGSEITPTVGHGLHILSSAISDLVHHDHSSKMHDTEKESAGHHDPTPWSKARKSMKALAGFQHQSSKSDLPVENSNSGLLPVVHANSKEGVSDIAHRSSPQPALQHEAISEIVVVPPTHVDTSLEYVPEGDAHVDVATDRSPRRFKEFLTKSMKISPRGSESGQGGFRKAVNKSIGTAIKSKSTRSAKFVRNTSSREPVAQIQYEIVRGRSTVHVHAKNIVANINILFIDRIITQYAVVLAALFEARRSYNSSDFVAQSPHLAISSSGHHDGDAVVRVTDMTSDRAGNIFKKYFQQFLLDFQYFVGDSMDFSMEIRGVECFVDSDFSDEYSGVALAIDNFAIHGKLASQQQTFEIESTLSSLSISLPQSPTRSSPFKKASAADDFLVNPIDATFLISNTDSTSADAIVRINISSPLHIDLDSPRTIRLMKLFEKMWHQHAHLVSVCDKYPVLWAKPDANLFDHFSDRAAPINPLRHLVTVEFNCASALVSFHYTTKQKFGRGQPQSIGLEIYGLNLVCNERLNDTKTTLTVSSFIFNDSLRPASSSNIVSAVSADSADAAFPLVHFTFLFAKKNSVLGGLGLPDLEADFKFGLLNINVDAGMLTHLSYVCEPIVIHVLHRMAVGWSAQAAPVKPSLKACPSDPEKAPVTNVLAGVGFENFLSSHLDDVEHISFVTARAHHTPLFARENIKISVVIDRLIADVAVVCDDERGVTVSPVCRILLSNSQCAMTCGLQKVRRLELSMGSVEVVDTRIISKEYFYTTVLRSGSVHQKGSQVPHMLAVNYSNVNLHNSPLAELSLEIFATTLHFASGLDIIIDITNTLTSIVYAFLTICSPTVLNHARTAASQGNKVAEFHAGDLKPVEFRLPGLEGNHKNSERRHDSLVSDQSNKSNFSFSINAATEYITVMLLADPMRASSSALMISCSMGCEGTSNQHSLNTEEENHELIVAMKENFKVAVNDIRLSCISDVGAWSDDVHRSRSTLVERSRQCCDLPLNVLVSLTRDFKQGVPLSSNFVTNLSDGRFSFTVDELKIVSGLLDRANFAGIFSMGSNESSIVYCVWGSDYSKELRVLTDISISVGTIVLESLIRRDDDLMPCLRASLQPTTIQLDGAMHFRVFVDSTAMSVEMDAQDLSGSATFNFALDFYHPVALQWEPILEPVDFAVNLGEIDKIHKFDISAVQSIHVNISGALLESLFYHYSELRLPDQKSFGSISAIKSVSSFGSEKSTASVLSQGLTLLENYKDHIWARLILQSIAKRDPVSGSSIAGIRIRNAFVSSFDFRLKYGNSKSSKGSLSPGSVSVVTDQTLSSKGSCSFQFSAYDGIWTEVILFPFSGVTNSTVPIVDRRGVEIVHLCVEASVQENTDSLERAYLDIVVYVAGLLVDCSNLGLSVKSRVKEKVCTRSTTKSSGQEIVFESKVRYISSEFAPDSTSPALNRNIWKSKVERPLSVCVSNVHYASEYPYKSQELLPGKLVHCDRNLHWEKIPSAFIGQEQLSISSDDFCNTSRMLLSFRCEASSIVFVLLDSSCLLQKELISSHWITTQGFVKVPNATLTAKWTSRGKVVEECHFVPFGRFFTKDEIVELPPIGDLGQKGLQYSVCIVQPSLISRDDESAINILYSVLVGSTRFGTDIGTRWLLGGDGICAFHCETSQPVQLGSVVEECWSDRLVLSSLSRKKQYFELDFKGDKLSYPLAYTIDSLPGVFHRSTVVTVMPYFCVLNCSDEAIDIRFASDSFNESFQTFLPFQSQVLHKPFSSRTSTVQFKAESTHWSIGGVDINSIGDSVIVLPNAISRHSKSSLLSPYIIRVEVRFAHEDDSCAVCILLWKESKAPVSSISICNESPLNISARQANFMSSSFDFNRQSNRQCEEIEELTAIPVPGGKWVPFGWANPQADVGVLLITLSVNHERGHATSEISMDFPINVLKLNIVQKIEISAEIPPVYIAVQPRGNGKVVRIVRNLEDFGTGLVVAGSLDSRELSSAATGGAVAAGAVVGTLLLGPVGMLLLAGGTYAMISKINADAKVKSDKEAAVIAEHQARDLIASSSSRILRIASKRFNDFTSNICCEINVYCRVLSVALIVEKPVRKEFLTVWADEIRVKVGSNLLATSMEVSIRDFQVDSFSETAISSTMVCTKRGPDVSPDTPVFQFMVVEEYHPEQISRHYKYIACRLLELAVVIDSASIQLLATDLGVDFNFMSLEHVTASKYPHVWVENFNKSITKAGSIALIADIRKSCVEADKPKLFIENLVIHPIKINMTFHQTILPRKVEQIPRNLLSVGLLSYIPAFASVDDSVLSFNSFIACNIMESASSLFSRWTTTIVRDLQFQATRLAGSLNVIGSPAVLVDRVGGGVTALFYEPYQGAMESPHAFLLGLQSGTSEFIADVVGGALTSTARVMSAASNGISSGIMKFDMVDDASLNLWAEAHRNSQLAAQRGVVAGLISGGELIANGFASGLVGLVSAPVTQGKEGGVSGFVNGLGIGIVGAGLKPILGVTDGLHSVAQTVLTQLGGLDMTSSHRERRIFHSTRIECKLQPSLLKSTPGIAAKLPEYVEVPLLAVGHKVFVGAKKLTRLLSDLDTLPSSDFPALVDIGGHFAVAFTQKHFHLKKLADVDEEGGSVAKNSPFKSFRNSPNSLSSDSVVDTVLRWKDVSHFVVSGPAVITIILNTPSEHPVDVICSNSDHAHELHRVMTKCSRLMKNPHLNTGVMPSTFSLGSNFGNSKSRKDSFRRLVAPTFAVASNSLLFSPTVHVFASSNIPSKLHPGKIRISSQLERFAKVEERINKLPRRLIIPSARRTRTKSFEDDFELWNDDRDEGVQVKELLVESSALKFQFGEANDKYFPSTVNFLTAPGETTNALTTFEQVECELCLLRLFTTDVIRSKDGLPIATKATREAWQRLDEIMWQLTREWNSIFFGGKYSRCASLAVINESSKILQFKNIYLKYGAGIHLMPGPGYIPELRGIIPGGCVVIFIWSDTPSILDDGHAKGCLITSGFSARFSTKKGFKLGVENSTASPSSPSASRSPKKGLSREDSHLSDSSDGERSEETVDYPKLTVSLRESTIESSWAKYVVVALDQD